MTTAKFKLVEAGGLVTLAPLFFCFFHVFTGERPLVTEFEAGAITGAVLLKLIEAARAALQKDSK